MTARDLHNYESRNSSTRVMPELLEALQHWAPHWSFICLQGRHENTLKRRFDEYQYAHCFADLPDRTRGLQWQGVRGCLSAIGSTKFLSGARHACNTGRRDASAGGAVRGGSTDGHQHGCENVCSEGHERKPSL